MSKLPTADWLSALSEMERTLAQTLAVQTDTPDLPEAKVRTEADRHVSLLSRLDAHLQEWDERQNAAAALVAAASRELNERERAFDRWKEKLDQWQKRLQQGMA